MAAIPDSSGVIHACRSSNNGSLRVIDSANQTCKAGETELTWNQTGPQGPVGFPGTNGDITAYFRVNADNTIDTASMRNVTSYLFNDGTGFSSIQGYCLQVSFEPKIGFGTSIGGSTTPVLIRSIDGNEELDQHCPAQYNVFMVSSAVASVPYQALLFD